MSVVDMFLGVSIGGSSHFDVVFFEIIEFSFKPGCNTLRISDLILKAGALYCYNCPKNIYIIFARRQSF